jgi:hypothetical protein
MVQDAVQGCHWTNGQVTLHTIAIYVHQPESPSKPKPVSLCIDSDCMVHVTSTFYAFQKVATQYIKTLDSNMRKVLYFSDGAVSHYNRKNFANLVNRKNDFGIAAEWHFFATGYGKHLCDAVGDKKWQAAKANLQRPYKQTLTPKDFYEFAQKIINGRKFFYVSKVDVTETKTQLKECFSNCMQIPDTRENHCYIPLNSNTMRLF